MIHGHSFHLQGQVGVHGRLLAHRDAVAEIPSPGNTERALDVTRLWEGQGRTQNPWLAENSEGRTSQMSQGQAHHQTQPLREGWEHQLLFPWSDMR